MSVLAVTLVGLLAATSAPDASPAPAPALSADGTASDVRCFLVTMQTSMSTDPATKAAGMIGSMYFLGRLDGRAPNVDLESQIIAQLKTMASEEFKAEAQRCGQILMIRGKATTDMGHDLMKKGQQMMQLENSR